MKNHKKDIVIILLAGGSGKRFNLAIDKQMIKINEITVLEKSIINFQKYLPNNDIQIVTNKKTLKKTKEIAKKYKKLNKKFFLLINFFLSKK